MFGHKALMYSEGIRNWSGHVSECLKAFERSPGMIEVSVERHFARRHELCNLLRGELRVAKKDYSQSDFKGFVNVPLSPEHKEAYQAWDIQGDDIWDGLATYGETGYKFSLSYNKANASWIGTFTASDSTGKNAGYAVSGFASSPHEAARVLLFKVSCILPDVWKEFKPLPSDSIG